MFPLGKALQRAKIIDYKYFGSLVCLPNHIKYNALHKIEDLYMKHRALNYSGIGF